jgi:hypothetical protein
MRSSPTSISVSGAWIEPPRNSFRRRAGRDRRHSGTHRGARRAGAPTGRRARRRTGSARTTLADSDLHASGPGVPRRAAAAPAPVGLRLLVRPDTVLRWHRNLMRQRHANISKPKRRGRPPTVGSIRVLVLRLVRENPWFTVDLNDLVLRQSVQEHRRVGRGAIGMKQPMPRNLIAHQNKLRPASDISPGPRTMSAASLARQSASACWSVAAPVSLTLGRLAVRPAVRDSRSSNGGSRVGRSRAGPGATLEAT